MADQYDPNDADYKNDPNMEWTGNQFGWVPKADLDPSKNGPAPAPAPVHRANWNEETERRNFTPNAPNSPGNAAPGTVYREGNRNIGRGGDLFAQDQVLLQGRDINEGAFAATPEGRALRGLLQSRLNMDATQEGFDRGGSERARGAQEGALQYLLDLAQGRAQSPAQMMMQQAADRNLADAAALGSSQRGLGAAAASANVAGQRAQMGQELTRDMGILRLQEQMQATQAAGAMAQGLRGQDIAQAQAQAQINQARDALNAQIKQKYLAMYGSEAEADRRAAMELEALKTEQALRIGKANQEAFQFAEKMKRGDVDRTINAVGGAGEALLKLAAQG